MQCLQENFDKSPLCAHRSSHDRALPSIRLLPLSGDGGFLRQDRKMLNSCKENPSTLRITPFLSGLEKKISLSARFLFLEYIPLLCIQRSLRLAGLPFQLLDHFVLVGWHI